MKPTTEHRLTKEQEMRFQEWWQQMSYPPSQVNGTLGKDFKQFMADEIARERERCIQILSLTEMGEKQARYLLTPDKE